MNEDDFDDYQLLLNARPVDDFMGLSASEMHILLYEPLSERSAVQINKQIPDAVLDQIPFFRLVEALISIVVKNEFVKLTPLGLLNKKTLLELYALNIYSEELVERGISKLYREDEWYIMISSRNTATMAGLFRKNKGKLLLTVKAKQILARKDRNELFQLLLFSFIRKFNWGTNDLYPEMNMLQQSAGYSLYMLHKCGNEFHPPAFYSKKLVIAFPKLPEVIRILDGEEAVSDLQSCFSTRFFERFTQWFNFTEAIGSKYSLDRHKQGYKSTTVFDQVFKFE